MFQSVVSPVIVLRECDVIAWLLHWVRAVNVRCLCVESVVCVGYVCCFVYCMVLVLGFNGDSEMIAF